MAPAALLRAMTRAAAAVTVALPLDAPAQKTLLEVRPRAGDTLHVILEHALTVSAAPRAGYAAVPASTTMYRLLLRDVVQRVTAKSAMILSIVDSASAGSGNSQNDELFPELDRSLQGSRIRLDIGSDGGSTVAEAPQQMDPDLRALIGETPPVLPKVTVAVGDTWTQQLPLPVDGPSTASSLLAVFRLDSLTDAGNLAWISLKGAVDPRGAAESGPRSMNSKGSLTGSLLLDRRRGWIIESRTTVDVESVVAMPADGEPLVVRVRVVQSMKTASAR